MLFPLENELFFEVMSEIYQSRPDGTLVNANAPIEMVEADMKRELGSLTDLFLSMWVSMLLSPFLLIIVIVMQTNIRQRYGILMGGNIGTILYAAAVLIFYRPTMWQTVIQSIFLSAAIISMMCITARYLKIWRVHVKRMRDTRSTVTI